MATFCIPPAQAAVFKQAVIDGDIDPQKMSGMSSEDRRAFIAKYVGPDNAREVNALFESKLLLKDQQRGLATWARTVAGVSEPARRDLLTRINKMDRILQPADQQSFLSDLAQKKLGVEITADEAKQIYEASQKAKQADDAWADAGRDPADMERRLAAGRAQQDLVALVDSMKPKPGIMSWNTVQELGSLPQQLLTSVFHMSGFFVQAANMVSRQRAWEGFAQMFRYMASEEAFNNNNAWITTHPDYPLLKQGKVALNKLGDTINEQEEYIRGHLVANISHYVSDATGIPDLVRGSSRAFTGFLNYVRAKTFYDMIASARARGEDLGPDSRNVRDIGNVVNTFSGRGNIGFNDSMGQAAPFINMFIWAPRKLSGTIGVFNPLTYLNFAASKTARLEALKNITGALAVTGSVIGLTRAMGGEVSLDPDDPKFMQVQIGGTSFDMGGGDYSYLRMMARVIRNVATRSYDYVEDIPYKQPFGTPTAMETVISYLRNKMVPLAAFVVDAIHGKDAVGRPFDPAEEAKDKLLPITMHEMLELFYNDPDNYTALAMSPISAFGIGMRTPQAEPHMYGMDMWGQPTDSLSLQSNDPVDVELRQIGYRPSFPSPNIQGVPLTGPQYRDYIRVSGENSRASIENDMSLPGWADYPKEQKLRMVRSDINAARRDAADQLMTDDLAAKPDGESIMDKATALQNQRQGIAP